MQILENKDNCVGCASCMNICPKHCIRMEFDIEGFLYPEIDDEACIECGLCKAVCPALNPQQPNLNKTTAVVGRCHDMHIRRESSSGGFFYYLARWILAKGGCIYGAAWDRSFNVVHIRCDNEDDIMKLLQAKYAQSEMGNCFKDIETDLQEGKCVLFSGTSCQVGAVKSYLRKDYKNLYLVDIICHGVPSPGVWRRYIDYRSLKDNGEGSIASINMRCKDTGWPPFSVDIRYLNGHRYLNMKEYDPYMRAFVHDLCLRKSCHICQYKGINRVSDLTLGDYWGIWDQMPEFDDGKGTSVVLIHTDKASEILEAIKKDFEIRDIDPALSVSENSSAEHSAPENPLREEFLKRVFTEDFEVLVDELSPLPAPKKRSKLDWGINKIKRAVKLLMGET